MSGVTIESADTARTGELAAASELLLELTSLALHEDPRPRVAAALRRLTGATLALFNDYDARRHTLRFRCVDMEAGLLGKAVELIGGRLEELEFPVSDSIYQEMVSRPVGRRSSLSEASLGRIPPRVGTVLQKLLRIDRFIGLAHVVEGRLRGTSVIGLHPSQPDPSEAWLRTVARTVALALRLRDTEEDLARNERWSRQLFETAPVPMCVFPRDGSSMVFNRRFTETFGYTTADVRTLADWHRLAYPDPEYRRGVVADSGALFDAGARTGRVGPVERRVTCKDGRELIGTLSGTRDGDSLVVAFFDLTERVRADEAMRIAHQRLRTLVESNIVGVVIAGAAGEILEANDYYLELIGCSRQQLQAGQVDWRAITPPEWLPADERALEQLRERGTCDPYEKEYLLASGKRVPVLLADSLLPGPDELIVAFALDMTERKRAEEALRASEARLRSILENMQDAYFRANLSGQFVAVSPSAARMYGYGSAGEMIGLPATTLYADTRVRDTMLEELRRTGRVSDWRGLARRADGTTFWVSLSAQLCRDEAGNVVGTEGVVRDVTERVLADEERRQLQASAAQSDRLASMGMLAAGVAHEINNPLAYSLYHLESLAEDFPAIAHQLDPALAVDVQERLDEAVSGLRKIKEISRGLSTFSRVEQDQLAPVDLRRPLESALTIAHNELKYRARVEKDLGETDPVLASEGRLSQVFLNLVVNAAQAIREGDVEHNLILIRTWQEGDTVLAEVRDTGEGILPEHLEQIFEPFYSTKPIGVGSGLGLNIVRNILTAYGGSIEVTSAPGAGASFLIRLPATSVELEAEEPGAGEPAADSLEARGRVLIVDDDAGIRGALHRILAGHELVEASSGERALGLLSSDHGFDVILCDMMMPTMSGMDLHRWIVEHQPTLARKVVFVTGGAFTPHTRAYLEHVENLCLRKPFDVKQLRRVVGERVLAGRSPEPGDQ